MKIKYVFRPYIIIQNWFLSLIQTLDFLSTCSKETIGIYPHYNYSRCLKFGLTTKCCSWCLSGSWKEWIKWMTLQPSRNAERVYLYELERNLVVLPSLKHYFIALKKYIWPWQGSECFKEALTYQWIKKV